MGLRTRLRQLLQLPATVLSGSAASVLEGAVRELIEEVIDARGLVRRAEVEAVEHRADGLRRELSERRAELAALTQSLDAMARELDDDLPLIDGLDGEGLDARLEALDAARQAIQERLERANGALAATTAQVASFTTRIGVAEERADKAQRVAHSALATAEAAADGVTGLEQRLAAR